MGEASLRWIIRRWNILGWKIRSCFFPRGEFTLISVKHVSNEYAYACTRPVRIGHVRLYAACGVCAYSVYAACVHRACTRRVTCVRYSMYAARLLAACTLRVVMYPHRGVCVGVIGGWMSWRNSSNTTTFAFLLGASANVFFFAMFEGMPHENKITTGCDWITFLNTCFEYNVDQCFHGNGVKNICETITIISITSITSHL